MLDLRSISLALLVAATFATGCSKQPSEPATAADAADAPADAADAPPAAAERPQLTADECTAQGGNVVGDIGDGAIHRADYVCPSGAAPTGSIRSEGDEPVAVEGSVCCPS